MPSSTRPSGSREAGAAGHAGRRQMTAAGPAGQDTTKPTEAGQQGEHGIEVEEILPGHLGYLDGQGRASHVWAVTTASARPGRPAALRTGAST
jgi:hypothetical protein